MTLDECSKLLGIIAGVEPRFRLPDGLITAMWHEILKDVPIDVAARAVADYYGRESERVIMPADIVKFGRRERSADAVPYHRPVSEIVAKIDAEIASENDRLAAEVTPAFDREEARKWRAIAAARRAEVAL